MSHPEAGHVRRCVVRLADQALYRAKETGKGRVIRWVAPGDGAQR
jgi:PleD family two-component response regulator